MGPYQISRYSSVRHVYDDLVDDLENSRYNSCPSLGCQDLGSSTDCSVADFSGNFPSSSLQFS